jgi:hypothetical protein
MRRKGRRQQKEEGEAEGMAQSNLAKCPVGERRNGKRRRIKEFMTHSKGLRRPQMK